MYEALGKKVSDVYKGWIVTDHSLGDKEFGVSDIGTQRVARIQHPVSRRIAAGVVGGGGGGGGG